MPRVHLLSGPRGAGKTDRLLREAQALVTDDPGSALFIVPAGPALLALRQRFAAAGPWGGWRGATFPDLVESLLAAAGPRPRTLGPGQRRLLAEEVAVEAVTGGELRHFARVVETAGFAEGLLGMADELAAAGVHPDALARAASRPEERERARLYERYRQQLARLDVLDGPEREAAAAGLAATSTCPLLEGVRAVFLDGFTDFTPGQHALVGALAGRVEAVWVSLLDEDGDDRAEVFARPRLTRGRLGTPATDQRLPAPADRPAGLAHLAGQLFRPLRRVEPADDAAGLDVIEAPGVVGEVRLVARRVKSLLAAGYEGGDLLLVARGLGAYADLVAELFAEYDVPVAVEGGTPLTRQPGVALLLRAVRLPEDDFPFAGLTALLRHGHFRPAWPEAGGAEAALLAEALLRLLGESRGPEAYLAAVDRWADAPPAALEDESAEESRRQRTHELALQCRPLLRRLLAAWDGAPRRAALAEHVAWARRLADDLGIGRAAEEDPRDRAAWAALWGEIDLWQRRLERSAKGVMDRRTFARRLATLAGHTSLPRPAGPGRVRLLSAEAARHLSPRVAFLLGLGERGFPRPGGPASLLGEDDRTALSHAGLALGAADPLADEMLLFTQVVTGARERLVLSYPAVDERGQDLLPGSFLLAVQACFRPGAVAVERRSMLLEGVAAQRPLSAAEYRVRVGMAWPLGGAGLPGEVRANLRDAAEVSRRRFAEAGFTAHDGLFTDPLLIDWVGRLFGRERVFSPTALEDYVACPFRFFLRHVLRLEPLDEPSEEVEVTRRGMTYHRALARLHQRLRDGGVHHPASGLEDEVTCEMQRAVEEEVARAAGPANKVLWRLEGERLLRSARRYPDQWARFVAPWTKVNVAPRPHLFEVDFGLPAPEGQTPSPPLVIRVEDVEVRVSGRIDRIDLATLDDGLGFWVIDYKTGGAGHYTGPDLAQFRRLQLTLYAHAVEAVFLAGRPARPLGLAYWLVSDTGTKVALPGRSVTQWRDDPRRWPAVRSALQRWVATLARNIRRGAFPLAPRSENCTQTCPYGPVCRIGQSRSAGKSFDLPLPGIPEGES